MNWKGVRTLVTGGASFIGSHLVDALVSKGARVRVVDDLSSGKLENIAPHINSRAIEFIRGDLAKREVIKKSLVNTTYVFHLAAIHGGRGFIDTHQAVCTKNVLMDTLAIQEAYAAGVRKFIFASSGCVYPNYLQKNPHEYLYLTEDMVGPPYDPDNTYGWAKLTTEITMRAYAKDYKLRSVSCRYFTVYGERESENHAVVAMIAKVFIKQNPYEVWGDGTQVRNWTYVGDIVEGTLKAAETIEDGKAVNLGSMERIRVIDAVKEIFRYADFHPRVVFKPNEPTGPYNRVCDNRFAKELLRWEPKMAFADGLRRTCDWYFATKKPAFVRKNLRRLLVERV